MASSLAYSPWFRMVFTDKNGKPLSNGTLTTFIAGSSTPVQTYNATGSEAQLNPVSITLDEYGACHVALSTTIAYKFVLKDYLGYLIDTIDNVSASGSSGYLPGTILVRVDGTENRITSTASTDSSGNLIYTVDISAAFEQLLKDYTDNKVSAETTARTEADTALAQSISNETERAEAAEAAAKSVVTAGTNVSVAETLAEDGHSIYNISTGQNKCTVYNNNSTTSNLYAKIASCAPYTALVGGYGRITGTYTAAEFNGAVTIFTMSIVRAVGPSLAYSGDVNAYLETKNLSDFSYANTSNLDEIRLYESADKSTVDLWVKLKTGYKNCQTSFEFYSFYSLLIFSYWHLVSSRFDIYQSSDKT